MKFLICLCLLSLVSLSAAEQKISVLDLEKVFAEASFLKHNKQLLKQERDGMIALRKEKQEQIKRLTDERSLHSPGKEKYISLSHEIEVAKLQTKLLLEDLSKRLELLNVKLLQDSYTSTKTLLNIYAQEQGLYMVLLAPAAELRTRTFNEASLEMQTQAILFHQESADITTDFIAWLEQHAAKHLAKDDKTEAAGDNKPAMTGSAPAIQIPQE